MVVPSARLYSGVKTECYANLAGSGGSIEGRLLALQFITNYTAYILAGGTGPTALVPPQRPPSDINTLHYPTPHDIQTTGQRDSRRTLSSPPSLPPQRATPLRASFQASPWPIVYGE